MPTRYKLTIAYDGTAYSGWQRQPDPVRTVQRAVEKAAGEIVNHPVTVAGSSRTDAGVHAMGQVAQMDITTHIEPGRLRLAINSRLPADILIRKLEPVEPAFDVSRAVKKRYRYLIWADRDRPVFHRYFVYHFWPRLNLGTMRESCKLFVGTHDFAAFQGRGDDRQTTTRTIFHCDIHQRGPLVIFSVEGSGFLYHMVRNMVGTVLETGRGHWPAAQVGQLLEAGEQGECGPCAPASGLCLQWIRFGPHASAETPAATPTLGSDERT